MTTDVSLHIYLCAFDKEMYGHLQKTKLSVGCQMHIGIVACLIRNAGDNPDSDIEFHLYLISIFYLLKRFDIRRLKIEKLVKMI